MKLIIRYRIQPEALDEHLRLLQEVFTEMHQLRPAMAYQAHQIDENGTFIEIVQGDRLPGPLTKLPAFQRYRAGLEARCTESPVMTEPTRSFDYLPAR